jgi:hypothetical protein
LRRLFLLPLDGPRFRHVHTSWHTDVDQLRMSAEARPTSRLGTPKKAHSSGPSSVSEVPPKTPQLLNPPAGKGPGTNAFPVARVRSPQGDKKVKTMSKAVAANMAATPTMVGGMGGGMCAKAPGLMELLAASVLVEVDADKEMIAELAATPLARQGSSSKQMLAKHTATSPPPAFQHILTHPNVPAHSGRSLVLTSDVRTPAIASSPASSSTQSNTPMTQSRDIMERYAHSKLHLPAAFALNSSSAAAAFSFESSASATALKSMTLSGFARERERGRERDFNIAPLFMATKSTTSI